MIFEEKPWLNEPDREEFKHLGFDCLLNRNHMGAWCGYVGVTKKHPAFGKYYNHNILKDILVHGGLTYASECQGHICHEVPDGEDAHVWWFGFDCAHCYDYVPTADKAEDERLREYYSKEPQLNRLFSDAQYRDIEYVRNEVKDLAEQLAKIC